MALSTTEVEYIALTEGAKEMVWLQRLLQELGLEQVEPTSIHSNNLGSITLSHNATYYTHTKHINIAYHFIHKWIVLDTDHRWISNKSVPLHHPPLYLPFPKSVPISITSPTLLHSSLFPLSHSLSLCSLFHLSVSMPL